MRMGLALAAVVIASTTTVPEGTRTYGVWRNGRELGTHVITLHATPSGGLVVEHKIRILVKVLFVTAYRYEADRTETWDAAGRLLAVHTKTNDNGHEMEVTNASPPPRVGVPGPGWDAFASAPPAQVIDPDTGRLEAVTVSAPTPEVLALGGKPTTCDRVSLHGEVESTMWFAPDGSMVKERLRARDGSTVETVLR